MEEVKYPFGGGKIKWIFFRLQFPFFNQQFFFECTGGNSQYFSFGGGWFNIFGLISAFFGVNILQKLQLLFSTSHYMDWFLVKSSFSKFRPKSMPIFTIKEKEKFILKLEVYNGFFIPISICKKMHNKEWATNFLRSKTLKQKKEMKRTFF